VVSWFIGSKDPFRSRTAKNVPSLPTAELRPVILEIACSG
jgi:hypothetical protein